MQFSQSLNLIHRNMSSSSLPKIILNETETKITKLLKDYVTFKNTDHSSNPLELRITGGWVRDKLLGNESNDLDIAINSQSGEKFADGLKQFISKNFNKYGIKPSGIHKIKMNPEKSKHLETATTKLYGLDIDFVNLRSEEYIEDSRIPQAKFGTPKEDALRRDATLNALFYNIQKDQVEDFTGFGLQDLKAGVLNTPLEPLKTFLDDPLRVLRLIRFASRFGFTIGDETLSAMRDPSIKEALLHKISRERVGIEIEKILSGPDPICGLKIIGSVGLFGSIFNFGGLQNIVLKLNNVDVLKNLFNIMETTTVESIEKIKTSDYSQSQLSKVINAVLQDKHLKKLFWLAIVLRPWSNLTVQLNLKKLKSSQASALIIKDGLRLSKVDADIIANILHSRQQYQDVVSNFQQCKRSTIGLLLRPIGMNYNLCLVINIFDEIIKGTFSQSKYESFQSLIMKDRLDLTYQLKPIIDGKTLSKSLKRKPGQWMSEIMDEILAWQLDHPEGSQEECIEFVKTIIV